MFRVSHKGEDITDVGSVEAVIPAGELGSYDVDEIAADPLPSGHTSRRWGSGSSDPMGDSRCSSMKLYHMMYISISQAILIIADRTAIATPRADDHENRRCCHQQRTRPAMPKASPRNHSARHSGDGK
jgi:hypothetical protein